MSSVHIPIKPNHVLHWKLEDDGSVRVEQLRFLYPGDAKLRALVPWNKRP